MCVTHPYTYLCVCNSPMWPHSSPTLHLPSPPWLSLLRWKSQSFVRESRRNCPATKTYGSFIKISEHKECSWPVYQLLDWAIKKSDKNEDCEHGPYLPCWQVGMWHAYKSIAYLNNAAFTLLGHPQQHPIKFIFTIHHWSLYICPVKRESKM